MTAWPLSEGPDAALLGSFAAGFLGKAPARIAVAVSGGGDSMALLHMALRAPFGWHVTAMTVDHGLRAQSAAEAAGVAAYCAAAGISHHTLRWDGPTPDGNLMDQARQARFTLMAGRARALGIGHILLGHTADDNAESFLMNLARSAGIDGLSGMRTDWPDQGVHWHRPLLQLTRSALRDYLTRNAVAWIDDPSNDNLRFTRVKARRALAGLAPLGITPESLTATIANLADARRALVRVTAKAAEGISQSGGGLILPRASLGQLDSEIARRLLSGIIRWMNGAPYTPRGSQLFAVQTALAAGGKAQLGGVQFRSVKDDWHVTRELRAVQDPVLLGQIWDHRWRITGPENPAYEIRALGPEGLALCPAWRNHGTRHALVSSPAIWSGDTLIAAPLAGKTGQDVALYQADVSQPLPDFILSH